MLGSIGLAILVPMEQREVDDPQEVVTLALDLERVGHVRTHAAQDLVREQARAGGEHHKVAGLDVHALAQSRHLLVREELDDGAVDGAILAEGDPGQALGANVEATPASLSILARAQAPAPLALMALTTELPRLQQSQRP